MKIGMMSFAHMHAYSYANHLKNMRGVTIAAIFDDDVKRGEAASVKYESTYFSNMDAFLAEDVDAVIICSENNRHKEMVLRAANAKKHILCEKPIATNKEDALEMIAACERNGVILQIAFPVRFSEPIQKCKEMINSGEIGKIIAMRTTNRGQNPGGWFIDPEAAGGGAVLDHTVHMVDVMRWYLGKEIKEIYATIDNYFMDENIDDAGLLTIEFEDGTIASHDTSWSRFSNFPAWGDASIEIIGTKKTVKTDAFGEKIMLHKNDHKSLEYIFAGKDMDAGLIEDFIDCVQNNREPSITGYDGLKAMEAALAAYESAALRKPITL